ncbi:peptide/nickel transport system substrate-binding protein [Mesobacillus persicus]|uniref:Peptide/nickel transport system substrate-binding protein n=1 Tax=Mesobacillus persicus TaxID=930146 RepID=A0A1H8D8X1_9BACI|nr:ABC transporter substrate-binding protein [Mesobacillus persicus]SEN03605.1 peptide/nickel transport system substrate-binding protein [Mesobacillus persicus]
MNRVKSTFVSKLFPLLLLAFIIAGCSSDSSSGKDSSNSNETPNSEEGTPKKGGEVTIAYATDSTNYDPILSASGSDHSLLWPIYDTLIAFSPNLEPQPGLAESWEFSDDAKTLTLHLREGVTFHDGTPFDGEAVKFNIERTNSTDSKVPDLNNIESVEVIDKKTVNLHLKVPDSSLLLALSDKGGMMVSPAAVQEHGDDFSQNPVGAGPFKRVKHIPNGEVVFEAYKDYWQEGKPYLDKMTVKVMADENTRINALKSGEIDFADIISPANVQSLKNDSNIVLKDILPLRFNMIFLNQSMPPFDNKNVRLAVLHGINREAIVQGLNFGLGAPANSAFPADYWAADPDMKIDYDPEKAKQLVKDSGLNNISFSMIHLAIANYTRGAEIIKDQLKEIGIDVNLEPMEVTKATTSFFSEQTAPAFSTTWTGRQDPQIAVQLLFSSNSYLNPGKHSTPEIESLISKAASIYDNEERAELYKEISRKALLEEAIGIPLVYEPMTSAMTQKVKGFEPNLMGKAIFSSIWVEE